MLLNRIEVRRLPFLLIVSLVCFGAGAAGCGGETSGGTNNNSVTICQDESDCPTGWTCQGNVCVESNADGGVDAALPAGEISIYPDPVQFGSASMHVDTMREVTVINVGEGDLTLTEVAVLEDDDLDEYTADPVGQMSLVLPPGDSQIIQVLLRPEDGELDLGELEVHSDDPVNPVVTVQLESEYKGTPTLEVCVLDDASGIPVPFVDCMLAPGTSEPIIDYGVIQFGVSASKVVAIRNAADGNAPLIVDGATVSSAAPAIENDFSVRLFVYDTDGVTEIDLTPPIYLSAGDPSAGLEPDLIYAEVTYGANVDGIVTSTQLELSTNDPAGNDVPISAAVSGCPTDYWDINGDPVDGCEYHCVYAGPEQCGSGYDDNCDGEQDEENAIGCTVYYYDEDNDGFGLSSNFQCLCNASGFYRATTGNECDDANNLINPAATEVCDGLDNDCNPATTEDFGTTTCGQGVCLNTVDNCDSGVPQSCDPLQGASTEVCDGLDNNCDGQIDEITQTDINNCGSCGNQCTNAHGSTLCSGGNCVPSCVGLWDDCDGNPDDGCETSISTTSNCGSCGQGCSVANGTATCSTGSCQISSCNGGYCDNNNSPVNGCEYDLDTNPACGSFIDIGNVNGDTSSSVITYYGQGERWYRVRVNENDNGCDDLGLQVELTPGAGTDYDLYIYCSNCGVGTSDSSSASGTTTDIANLHWDDTCVLGIPTGSDNSRYIYIQVRFWSGNNCNDYTLRVRGNIKSGPSC